LSALFSSNEALVTLSSNGMNRTLAFADMDCVLGEISASMVYCSTSMREVLRRSWAGAASAAVSRIKPAAREVAVPVGRLRNMSNLSFQNFLNQRNGLRRRSAREFLPHFGQAGLHFRTRGLVG